MESNCTTDGYYLMQLENLARATQHYLMIDVQETTWPQQRQDALTNMVLTLERIKTYCGHKVLGDFINQ